jgi:hypothetical protein
MLLGIISDTHGHVKRTYAAIAELEQRNVSEILHCGDINTPEVVRLFAHIPTLFVYGNVDRRREALQEAVDAVFRHGSIAEFHTIVRDGKEIGICHGHTRQLSTFLTSNAYDYVLSGHTHVRKDERQGRVRAINPGAVAGLKRQSRSCAVLDTERDELEFIEVS